MSCKIAKTLGRKPPPERNETAKTVLLQIAQKPRIIRETRPKWTFSRSRISLCKSLGKLPMSTSNQETNVTVRDIACSKSVEKKSAGGVGKMGNFHFKKMFDYHSNYFKL